MTGYDRLVRELEAMIEAQLSQVNTTLPGRVLSYDPGTNRAVVQPILPKRLADGGTLPAPAIVSVPLIWPTAGGATITMPVSAGDGVMLHFSSRSLEGWLSGQDGAPDDPRQFDLSDAIATPGLVANRGAPVDGSSLVISFGGSTIRLEPGGTVRIQASNIVLEGANLTHNGKNVGDTHAHGGVMSGGSLTGPPA